MTNNNILRTMRYIFDFSDHQMSEIYRLAEQNITQKTISSWLKKEDHEAYAPCSDSQLLNFLDGYIQYRRGKREGEQKQSEAKLSNNLILRKLKIAHNLKSEDMLEILKLADFSISKSELSALFRKTDHKHYRVCKDQFLRNFLRGLQVKYRS